MGAIFGIIQGLNLKITIFFYEILFLIALYKCIYAKKQPNAGAFIFLILGGTRAGIAWRCLKKKNKTPTRFGGQQKISNRKIKKYFRYIKIIFNKKVFFTFTISAIIFNTYTIFLNKQYENFYNKVKENIEIEAVIISASKESEYYTSYIVKGNTKEFKNKRFILYVKKGTNLEYGDKIRVIGEFYEPEDSRNYKGFSYKKYLQTEKIYGTIKAKNIEIKSKNNTVFLFKLSNSMRNRIIEQIKNILPEETSGLLAGLMLGDKTYISDEIKSNFQKSSLAHILAVSGAHVSYIILGLTYAVSINKMPKKRGYIFIIFSLNVFIFITNFSVSVVRACVMSIIFIISKLFYRKLDIKNTIAISLLIILIHNPYSINSVSMQLSYLGTIGVIFIAPTIERALAYFFIKLSARILGGHRVRPYNEIKNSELEKINNKLAKIISVPIAAQIAILPIMVKNFNTISFTFLISNIIAMPLLGISIIGGYLLTLVSFISLNLTRKVGIIFNLILRALILIAKFFANLKLSNIYVITPNTITIVIYYIVVFLGIYVSQYISNLDGHRARPYIRKYLHKISYKKIIIFILILIVIIEIPYESYNGKLKIYFIDIGQRRQYPSYNSKRKENINRWRGNRPKHFNTIPFSKKNKNIGLCYSISL
ncbi:MAG: ComEC/Rec2 family competence protein [Clostridia bacterium]